MGAAYGPGRPCVRLGGAGTGSLPSWPDVAVEPGRPVRDGGRRGPGPGGGGRRHGADDLRRARPAGQPAAHAAAPRRASDPATASASLLRNGRQYLERCSPRSSCGATPFNVNDRYTADELRVPARRRRSRGWSLHEPDLGDRLGRRARDRAADASRSTPRTRRAIGTAPAARPARRRPQRRRPLHPLHRRHHRHAQGRRVAPRGPVRRRARRRPRGEEPTPPTPRRAWSSGPSPNRLRCLPASPLTHGTAQWSALATLLRRRHGRAAVGRLRRRGALVDRRGRGASRLLVIVGDAFARPLADALAAEPDRWDLEPAAVGRLGRRAAVARGPRRSCSPACRGSRWSTATAPPRPAARARAWPGPARPTRGTSRFQVGAHTAVLDDDGRPSPPGIGRGRDGRPPRARSRSATTATTRDAPGTFPTIDGVRWAVPGDLGHGRGRRHASRCSAGASSSINTGGEKVSPDEVEAVLKAHPDVFDAVVLGVRRRPLGRAGGRRRAAPRRAPARRRRPRPPTAGPSWPTSRSPARCVLVDAVRGCPPARPTSRGPRAVVDRTADRRASDPTRSGYRSAPRWSSTSPSSTTRSPRAYPDREASSGGDRRFTYGRPRRAQPPPRQRAARPRASASDRQRPSSRATSPARTTLALYLHNGNEYLEGMLGAFKARVAPFNVNYRYVAEELALPAQRRRRRGIVYHAVLRPDAGRGPARPARPRACCSRWPTTPASAARPAPSTTRSCSPPSSTERPARRPRRPTTSTSSTPAAPPACPRACCGASTTSSSAPWAAGPSAQADAFAVLDAIVESAGERRRSSMIATPPLMHGAAQWADVHLRSPAATPSSCPTRPDRLDPADVLATRSSARRC